MKHKVEASFRDKSGFVFEEKGIFYRQINHSYKQHYEHLMVSGLYEALTQKGWLLSHEELFDTENMKPDEAYKIIRPVQLTFISYPYSWSFGMLKDAALLTLKIQKLALKHGMILKDASAYNVQFIGSQAILIDTLSFEVYTEGESWMTYGQFCRHFLAPLALMACKDVSLNKLLMVHLDGIPLPLASKLLPLKTHFNIHLALHVHLHARTQVRLQDKKTEKTHKSLSKNALLHLIESLESAIKKLNWQPKATEWHDYYDKSVGKAYFEHKKELVKDFLEQTATSTGRIMDLGANDGTFSQLAAKIGKDVLSFDIDPACVEQNYQKLKIQKETRITPIIVDVTNPDPAIGWQNQERTSLWERTNAQTVMALALIHHLCISNNIPLIMVAKWLRSICDNLIIEFVPKADEKVQILLQNRLDIFDDYTIDNFIIYFSQYFNIKKQTIIAPTERILFLMSKKQQQ
jgi:ribosomal protein L11 methylase PrmA